MKFLTISTFNQPEFVKDVTAPLQAAWLKIAEIVGGLLPKLLIPA